MPEPEASRVAGVAFEGVNPILRVQNLQTSIDYYTKVLGFKVDWQSPGILACVSRDRCGVFLCEGDQGNPGTWLWIGVTDVASLFSDYTKKGATIRHPPTNYPWAREMQVEDPDGNVLRFGSESTDQPFGEWLDMRGEKWKLAAEGRWIRVGVA
jgi:catechol 2,3-dioxygenase-like lactoylglutathione lyase family enzyme